MRKYVAIAFILVIFWLFVKNSNILNRLSYYSQTIELENVLDAFDAAGFNITDFREGGEDSTYHAAWTMSMRVDGAQVRALWFDDDDYLRIAKQNTAEFTTGGMAEMVGVVPSGGMALSPQRGPRRAQYVNRNVILLVTSSNSTLQGRIREVFLDVGPS